MTKALLIGGRFDRVEVQLSRTPARVQVAGELYERLDDPDTGEYLGGYTAAKESPGEACASRMVIRTTAEGR